MTNNNSFNITDVNVELLHDTQASIIVSCAQDPNMAYTVAKFLESQHFSEPKFQKIWEAIKLKLEASRANEINLTTLQLEAQRRNLDVDLSDYLDFAVEDEDVVISYARQIKEIYLRKHLRDSISNIHIDDMSVEDVVEDIRGITNDIENELTDITISKTLPEMFDDLQEFLEGDELPQLYRFGLPGIDESIVDFAPGNTVIIGATPGQGKTALGIFMAIQNGWMGVPTHFFSLEMSERQIIARFLNAVTGISAKQILRKQITKEELERLKDARKTLEKLPIIITPYADIPISTLLQSMRDSKIRHGTEVFFIDYIQLISVQGRTKREEASFVAQKLKSMALELDACIVQMSQLSRNNKVEPDMHDLKETSDLEQAASLIVLLYADKLGITDHLRTVNSYPIFFKVAKQRNGEVFKKLLDFIPSKMQFKLSDFDIKQYEKELTKNRRKDTDEKEK